VFLLVNKGIAPFNIPVDHALGGRVKDPHRCGDGLNRPNVGIRTFQDMLKLRKLAPMSVHLRLKSSELRTFWYISLADFWGPVAVDLAFGLLLSASETPDIASGSDSTSETLSLGKFFLDLRGAAFFGAATFLVTAFFAGDFLGAAAAYKSASMICLQA
jgi:hypothetical protein